MAKSLELLAEQAVLELTEFYSKTELTQYMTHCKNWGLPLYQSMIYLKDQAVLNINKEYDITDGMIDVYNHFSTDEMDWSPAG